MSVKQQHSGGAGAEHIGCLVSARCEAGLYQGTISAVDVHSQAITLQRPFLDGLPCQMHTVTLRSAVLSCRAA